MIDDKILQNITSKFGKIKNREVHAYEYKHKRYYIGVILYMEKYKKTKRISIIGGSGSGKSTLSKNLAKKYNLPVIHIDAINYDSNWVEKDKKRRDELILEIIKDERWIIDGTYTSTLHERLFASDLIIFLDYSTMALLYGVISRKIRLKGKEREEVRGCKDRLSFDFLKFVLTWRKKHRKAILEKLKLYNEKILIFSKRKSLNNWYKEEFNEKMVI